MCVFFCWLPTSTVVDALFVLCFLRCVQFYLDTRPRRILAARTIIGVLVSGFTGNYMLDNNLGSDLYDGRESLLTGG